MKNYVLILIDDCNWGNFLFAPQYIIGVNDEFIPLYIGNNGVDLDNTVGVYVNEEDYYKIDHTKEYIMINTPEPVHEELKDAIENSKKLINDVDSVENLARNVINLGVEMVYDENPKLH